MNVCNPRFIYLPAVPSTNTHLKQLIRRETLQEGTVVYTFDQQAGRGQAGASWESEPGKNLTFSILLFPYEIKVKQQFLISQLTALAIRDVLSEETPFIALKWPNDIYYRDEKIAGILIENEIEGNNITASVIGVGLNVNQTLFVGDAPNPVSLRRITGKTYDLQTLMQSIVARLLFLYEEVRAGRETAIVARYKESLYRGDGKFYPFVDKTGRFSAKIDDVEPTGTLVLLTETGNRQAYLFKQISFVL
jgi:BirA family biotin operon repressor/biotin-[acetyl-CoA-carboxylase] ligase